eukprot:795961-Rhodomonas_salina.1
MELSVAPVSTKTHSALVLPEGSSRVARRHCVFTANRKGTAIAALLGGTPYCRPKPKSMTRAYGLHQIKLVSKE